ncbi:unnamed protein product [Arabidopsis halleri]
MMSRDNGGLTSALANGLSCMGPLCYPTRTRSRVIHPLKFRIHNIANVSSSKHKFHPFCYVRHVTVMIDNGFVCDNF